MIALLHPKSDRFSVNIVVYEIQVHHWNYLKKIKVMNQSFNAKNRLKPSKLFASSDCLSLIAKWFFYP